MNNPYSTLGVSASASDDEIKKAYRDLARKYHPDNYTDNPLADLAQEKMKEINAAYEEIQKERSGGNSGQNYSAGRQGAYQSSYQNAYQRTGGSNDYNRIRDMINRNQVAQAEAALNSMSVHDAEWNYLMGSVCYRKGWTDEASRYFRTASTMAPGNAEYRAAVTRMNQTTGGFYNSGSSPFGNMQMNQADLCNCCSNLMVADCCCEMLGGDLIPCC